MMQIVKKEIPLFTWIRYHAWIVLYPIGGYCECKYGSKISKRTFVLKHYALWITNALILKPGLHGVQARVIS